MRRRPTTEWLEWALLITVVGTIASVLYEWYAKEPRKHAGSFEYVRKGEDLLFNGRAGESIKYFEMAYALSPDNSAIASELAGAHSKYGSSLAEAGDYDRAVKCVQRAREIKPGPYTMQNLAIMYSKKAASQASADPDAARADFEMAREAASGSPLAVKNLGVHLYNAAVDALSRGEEDLTILLLRESALAYEDSPALELLGDIYFRKTGFEKARFFYRKALTLDRPNRAVRRKLQKTIERLESAKRQESMNLPHFEVRYDKKLAIDAGLIERLLERCYFDVGKDLKFFPDSKTAVFLYSRGGFNNISKPSAAIKAFYDGAIHIPLPEETLGEEGLYYYMLHEYTHAVVSAMTNNNCPVGLSEGLAMLEEYRDREGVMAYLFSREIGKGELSLERLSGAFDMAAGDPGQIEKGYLTAYSVVRYIIDGWGMEGMRNLLARIRDGQHFSNAIDDEFLLSKEEFERRWKDYVIRRFLKR